MDQSVVSSLFKIYLRRSDLRESSIEIKSRAVRWFVELIGDMDVKGIRYSHAEDYKSWLAKGRSKSSANSYLRNLKPFFSWMFRSGYITENPFTSIKLYVVGESKKAVFEADEIERILKVADLRWQVIVLLGLCSMRRGEILNLCISDIDFEKNYILISPKKNTENTWSWEIKDHNQAYVGLPGKVADLIIQLMAEMPAGQPYVCLKPGYYARLIELSRKGELDYRKRLCPWGNFNRDFYSLLKRAKVSRKKFHALRATFATDRYNAGYDIKKIQYLLRHSSIQTTVGYVVKGLDEQQLVAESNGVFDHKYYASKVL